MWLYDRWVAVSVNQMRMTVAAHVQVVDLVDWVGVVNVKQMRMTAVAANL